MQFFHYSDLETDVLRAGSGVCPWFRMGVARLASRHDSAPSSKYFVSFGQTRKLNGSHQKHRLD